MEYINSEVGKNLVVNRAGYLLDRKKWKSSFLLALGKKKYRYSVNLEKCLGAVEVGSNKYGIGAVLVGTRGYATVS